MTALDPGATPPDRRRSRDHWIAEVRFALGRPGCEGDIVCACGWVGKEPGFQPHRRASG